MGEHFQGHAAVGNPREERMWGGPLLVVLPAQASRGLAGWRCMDMQHAANACGRTSGFMKTDPCSDFESSSHRTFIPPLEKSTVHTYAGHAR